MDRIAAKDKYGRGLLQLLLAHSGTSESFVKEHIILGTDKEDAERQKDLWLAQHPSIRILNVHPPKLEQHLLARIGGRNVPRVSIAVDYEDAEMAQNRAPS
jgi:hypothetical protein